MRVVLGHVIGDHEVLVDELLDAPAAAALALCPLERVDSTISVRSFLRVSPGSCCVVFAMVTERMVELCCFGKLTMVNNAPQ